MSGAVDKLHGRMFGLSKHDLDVKVPPGQTVVFREVHIYDPTFSSGTAFVLFCKEPGHYELGVSAGIVVKSLAAKDRRPLEYRTIAVNGATGGLLAVGRLTIRAGIRCKPAT